MGKSVDSVHGAVDRADPVHRGPAAIAASLSSSGLGLWLLRRSRSPDEGRGGRGKHGGPASGLTGARKAVERRHDDSERGEGQCAGERLARAKREAKEGVRRGGAVRGCSRWLL
jgi:hypothetical protein